jgi:hypothetical protein
MPHPGTMLGCVLFACTGITNVVSVSVTVDVAEATLAVDVKFVMPTAWSPSVQVVVSVSGTVVLSMPSIVEVGTSSARAATGTSAEVNPRYPESVGASWVAEATAASVTEVVLEKVLLQVKLLPSYACKTVLVSSANTFAVTQTVGATVTVEKASCCAESVTARAGSCPPWVKVPTGTSVGNDLRS